MAFCRTCGKQIHDEAVICPLCGVSTEDKKKKSTAGLVAAGYICAFLSLFIFPPGFGAAGGFIGMTNLIKGSVGHGIAQIVISITCGILGMVIGAALAS